jgi:hypothetical protein
MVERVTSNDEVAGSIPSEGKGNSSFLPMNISTSFGLQEALHFSEERDVNFFPTDK